MIADGVLAISGLVAFPAAIAFPFYYHWKSQGAWRDTAIGRHIMAWSSVFGLLYLSGVIRWFVPDQFLQLVVRPAIGILCAIVVWQRFILFRKILNEPAPEELAALPIRSALMTEPEGTETQIKDVEEPLTAEQVAYVSKKAGGCDDIDPYEDTDSFREAPR
jgi:hypothetical protein